MKSTQLIRKTNYSLHILNNNWYHKTICTESLESFRLSGVNREKGVIFITLSKGICLERYCAKSKNLRNCLLYYLYSCEYCSIVRYKRILNHMLSQYSNPEKEYIYIVKVLDS